MTDGRGNPRAPRTPTETTPARNAKREIHPALERRATHQGALWAEHVARLLVARWPSWRPTPRSLSIAARKVQDLAGNDLELLGRLARICHDAKRFAELGDLLARRRLDPPPRPGLPDDETPL
jgi:hypothetical protein